MKTVMKKMFCLLLVAVMLVSAVPVAFADAPTCDTHEGSVITPRESSNVAATCTTPGKLAYKCAYTTDAGEEKGHVIYGDEIPALGHTPGAAATCTTAQVCTVCWQQIEGAKGHTRGAAATCSAPQKCSVCQAEVNPVDPNNHTYSNGRCTGCGICENCKQATCTCCPDCGQATGHATTCPTLLCDNGCGAVAHSGACCSECGKYGHQKSACDTLYETCCNVAKGAAHRSDCVTKCTRAYNCTNANHYDDCKHALCDTEGCKLNEGHIGEHTGVPCSDDNCNKALGHDGKHSYQCQTSGCDKTVNHTGNCSNDPVEIPGNSDLHVFVNLYTADTLTKTVHLKTYEDISEDTLIYDFISAHAQELDDELEDDGHYGYSWSGHVYDENNKGNPVTMKKKVGEGATVHINAYTDQDLIYIYVHNSRTMNNLRIIQLPGKKVGETITKPEVTKAVSKYFNVSSLSMYSEQAWEDYVDGDSVDAVSTLEITSDPYFIDVKISGTAKSSSGSSYTADSSNPKTGDSIYAPVMIMGASVTALAVLFYLNKKRAY